MDPTKILKEGRLQSETTAISSIVGAIYPFIDGKDEDIVNKAYDMYQLIKDKVYKR